MMNEVVLEKLKIRSPELILDSTCRKAAVVIPVLETENGSELLFERRSSKIPDQPGDVCFPGGMAEPGETLEETAVREICEELMIPAETVSILFPSDYFHLNGVVVYPFVAQIKDYAGTFSTDEVSEVFTVPLDFFLNTEPENHPLEWRALENDSFPYDRVQGGRNYRWRPRFQDEWFYDWNGITIWGITAAIVRSFADMIKESIL